MKQGYIKSADLEPYFFAVSGRLGALPKKYKKWGLGRLSQYRSQFSFIKDDNLRESISRLRMSFDYQFSLYNWLKPDSIFEEHHKFVLVNLIAQLYEGLLFYRIKDEMSEKLSESKLISRLSLGDLINVCHDLRHINQTKKISLLKINEIRNMIHTTNWTERRLEELKIFNIETEIAELENYIRGQSE